MTQTHLADRIAALRTQFLSELGATRSELTSLLMRIDQTAPESDEHKRLLTLTHSLAGRGGTFGFPNLSDAAAEANALLERDGPGLRDAAQVLIGELSRVLDPAPTARPE